MSTAPLVSCLIWGRKPVRQALTATHIEISHIWLGDGQIFDDVTISLARTRARRFTVTTPMELTRIVGHAQHQKAVADVRIPVWPSCAAWSSSVQTLAGVNQADVLVLDHVHDPQNFGAILRSAMFFGVQTVVFPRDRSAQMSGTVVKASAGAALSINLIQVVNLARELKWAESAGLWRVGLVPGVQQSLTQFKPPHGPVMIVLGNEETGLRRLTQDLCDELLNIESVTGWDSLNVSAAAAVVFFERQKNRLRN